MVNIQKIATKLAGKRANAPVRISWSDNKAIRVAHASYSIFYRQIWVSTIFQDAQDEMVSCLIAHELGHAEDKLLHALTVLCLGSWLVCGGLILFASGPFLSDLAFVLMVVGICGGLVLLSEKPFHWEARADQWAEKVVGKDVYWPTKTNIREWADHTQADRLSR
jgi:hypothetical protein